MNRNALNWRGWVGLSDRVLNCGLFWLRQVGWIIDLNLFARLQICLVRIIWRHVISYRDRLGFRLITINYLGLTSLVVPNFIGIWRFRPNDLCSIWQTYRLSLGIRQGHRAAIKAVTFLYLFTVSQGDRLPSRNGVFTLISLSHHIDGHWNLTGRIITVRYNYVCLVRSNRCGINWRLRIPRVRCITWYITVVLNGVLCLVGGQRRPLFHGKRVTGDRSIKLIFSLLLYINISIVVRL